jgi:hypothetical protein
LPRCISILVNQTKLAFFLLGVVLILGGIFLGGYAGGWTFLFPLPSHGLGALGTAGAACFLFGLLLIGVGFLLLYLDVARAVIARYGSLSRGLGWPQLFGVSGYYSVPRRWALHLQEWVPLDAASSMISVVVVLCRSIFCDSVSNQFEERPN